MIKIILSFFLCAFYTISVNAQANIDYKSIKYTWYVNNLHPNASDENPGLVPDKPLLSIEKALILSKNVASKIVIFPGTYRNNLNLFSNELLILEASGTGDVTISGSDRFKDWQKTDKYYYTDWHYNWGAFEDSSFCFGPCKLDEVQKRREILFIDGENVVQVVSKDSLVEKTFFVDEENNKIILYPPKNIDPNQSLVEISTRGYDIYDQGRNGSVVEATVYNSSGLVIKGITFEHAANIAHQGCLTILNTNNLLIEDCIFQWNNGVGLELENCSNVSIINSKFQYNGQRGMGIGHGENMVMKNLEVSYNNWRMNAPKMIAHDAAGIKVFGSTKNVILDSIHAHGNYCSAIWFDWNNENYKIKNSVVENNQEAGLMLEGSRKPAYVKKCIVRNNGVGIKGYGHANVMLDSCIVYDNSTQLSLGQDGRIVEQDDDWEINTQQWNIFYSKFIANNESQEVLSFFEYHNPNVPSTYASTDFFETVKADYNTYYHPTREKIFPDGHTLNSNNLTLKSWQSITGQDKNSVFTPATSD